MTLKTFIEGSKAGSDRTPTPRGVSKARHDLRDRLSAVQGYGELLHDWRDLPGWESWRAGLDSINQSTAQLVHQLNQTLEWSNIEAGLSDLTGLQNSIRTLSQLVQAMAENLSREIKTLDHPAVAMVPRYVRAAQKLLELAEKTLSSLNPQEDWGSLPPELFTPVSDETRFISTGKQGTILVADDSEENRDLLRHRLEWQGYTVHLVKDGQEVIEFVTSNPVDLILLDLVMPVLDGLGTLKQLKGHPDTSHLPVIMLSSNDTLPSVIRSLQFGADDFLPKPFNPTLLAARVEASLAKKRLREREKSFHEYTLGLHLGKGRARQVLKNPELLRPGAVKQEVSFLFSDISNFSRIADRKPPAQLFTLLNRYYQTTISCIHEHQGTVVQLIGDAIFAIWNAPELQPNHQALACRAAWALRQQLVKFNNESKSVAGVILETRLGLHSGDACVGNLGSEDRFEFTAIGANANLASRLEGLNKHLGTEVLLTLDLLEAAEASGFVCRPLGQFKFKGLDRVVQVFELLCEKNDTQPDCSWKDKFVQGLGHFNSKEFSDARNCFKDVLRARPRGDGPARFYLQEIDRLLKEPPEADWFGEVRMDGK